MRAESAEPECGMTDINFKVLYDNHAAALRRARAERAPPGMPPGQTSSVVHKSILIITNYPLDEPLSNPTPTRYPNPG